MSLFKASRSTARSLMALLVGSALIHSPPEAQAGQSIPDLYAAYITSPSVEADPGDVVAVSITVNDNNFLSPYSGEFDYEIRLSIDSIITGSDPLVTTGTRSKLGTLNRTVILPPSLASAKYFWGLRVLPVDDETNVDNNSISGFIIDIGEPAPGLPPDLIPTLIEGPAEAEPGSQVQLDIWVQDGNWQAPYSGEFEYEVRLSSDATITASDPLVAHKTWGSLNHFITLMDLPESIAPGTYHWGLMVLPVEGEAQTLNNTLAGSTVSIPAEPDVAAISISGPTAADLGETVTVRCETRATNHGQDIDFTIYLHIQDSSGYFLPNKVGEGAAAAGEFFTEVQIPSDLAPGSYAWKLEVLDPGEVSANDRTTGNLCQLGGGPAPDLVAVSIQGPVSAHAGDSVTVQRQIEASHFNGSFDYSIRLSRDQTINRNDLLMPHFDSQRVYGQKPITVDLPSDLPAGSYYWGLLVGQVDGETQLGNNSVAGGMIDILGAPDLRAMSLSGPSEVWQGDKVYLTRNIVNLGAPLADGFEYQIRLSDNDTITTSDLLLKSFSSHDLGGRSEKVTIPASLSPGSYFCGLTVDRAPGELDISNNWVAGQRIEVRADDPPDRPDLELDSTSEVSRNFTEGDTTPRTQVRSVKNVASSGSALLWSVQGAGASWLELTQASGSVPAGAQVPVTIRLLPEGLAAGTYETTLTFINNEDPTDLETLEVRIHIDLPSFAPGEVISGFSSPATADRELTFIADAGMKLKIKSLSHAKKLKLRIAVLKPDGTPLKGVQLTRKRRKASIRLAAFGEYTLRISNESGTGQYDLKTRARSKKGGSSMLGDSNGNWFSEEVSALAGSRLDLTAVSTRRYEGGELTLRLLDAHGRLLRSASSAGGATVEISELEIPADGQYSLRIEGIAGRKSVKFAYTLELPEEPDEVEVMED